MSLGVERILQVKIPVTDLQVAVRARRIHQSWSVGPEPRRRRGPAVKVAMKTPKTTLLITPPRIESGPNEGANALMIRVRMKNNRLVACDGDVSRSRSDLTA
jgi:hypothetical protein